MLVYQRVVPIFKVANTPPSEAQRAQNLLWRLRGSLSLWAGEAWKYQQLGCLSTKQMVILLKEHGDFTHENGDWIWLNHEGWWFCHKLWFEPTHYGDFNAGTLGLTWFNMENGGKPQENHIENGDLTTINGDEKRWFNGLLEWVNNGE